MAADDPAGAGGGRPISGRTFALGALVGGVVAALIAVVVVNMGDDGDATVEASTATEETTTVPTTAETPVPQPIRPEVVESPSGASADSTTSTWTEVPTTPVTCPEATTTVTSAGELESALASVQPGDTIEVADGTYEGKFVATASGTSSAPIFLCGSAAAILDGGGVKAGYVLHLDHVEHWRVVGLTITNGQKGVIADGVQRSVIQGLSVHDIGDEGIHLRSASSNNAVVGNTVRNTGLRRDKFGEGIYVGSATSNWEEYSGGGPDKSDHNLVQGNTISQTTSESIDIKEGTTGGRLLDNVLDGGGTSAADSLVDVKGNDWLIQGNVVRVSPGEGMQTHRILDGWGTGNRFEDNTVDVVGDGNHFYVHDPNDTDNVVSCTNHTAAGGPIRSNVECVS